MTASTPPVGGPAGADPSMEDILASIRRILSEDDGEAAKEAAKAAAQPAPHAPPESDVLALDASMLVDDPADLRPPRRPEPPPEPALTLAPAAPAYTPPPAPPPAPAKAPPLRMAAEARPDSEALLGDAAASAAASSMGSLLRTLASERNVAVHRGGPTLEDLVREEMRPILKQWLDSNLPPLVERLVRAEIERVVGRALS